MSLTNPKTAISEQDLKDFYDKIKPFLAPKTYAGFTPIGTIISVFGEYAPANYLICDGATYNVADYPELAAHLLNLTTHSQYEVSGDNTKFKVPDLRGEFLRGTGTNSHTNQGNGANVGVHQDGTGFPALGAGSNGTDIFIRSNSQINSTTHVNGDKVYKRNAEGTLTNNKATGVASTTRESYDTVTVRPTNTSVLFCIATKNIYLDPKNDYSTEEKVVGTWIDGKTLYQRTVNVGAMPNATESTYAHSISNIDKVITYDAIATNTGGATMALNGTYGNSSSSNHTWVYITKTNIIMGSTVDRSAYNLYVTIQYTKTS